MAVMVTNIWTPNSSGAVPQLTENLIISRDAMRKDGFSADVLALLPGGGGVQGEMALVMEFDDWAGYAAGVTNGPSPSFAEAQASLKYSDSTPIRSTSWTELPGMETAYSALPKGVVMTSYSKIAAGKAAEAIARVSKSKDIMERLGGNIRLMVSNMSNPAGMIIFGMYYESAAAMAAFGDTLNNDDEWQAHWNDASSFGVNEIVRQSGWQILD